MSTTTTIQAEASKPQINKMQECRRCKDAGFPNQLIGFEKLGDDPSTGKVKWKLVNGDGQQHIHKTNIQQQQNYDKPVFKRRRVVDIATVTDVQEAKKSYLNQDGNTVAHIQLHLQTYPTIC